MSEQKIDMALDDIIKKNRNRRGRGNMIQRRGGNNQRGFRGGRVGKNNNNRGRGGGNFRRGGGRNSFGQRNNRLNNFRQQRGRGRNSIPGFNRRNLGGDKPTATYNPLNRDAKPAASKQQQQQQVQTTPRKQQGSIFNKVRRNQNVNTLQRNQNVNILRRRMVAAQRALNRATKTLAAMPRIKQQRQRFLQQPQKLRNIITRNRVGGVRKRLNTGRKQIGRGGARRMFL